MNSNNSNVTTGLNGCPEKHDSSSTKAIKTLAYCVIILISLVGNSLVITVIWKVRRMATNTNRFIVNMCISDLLVTICVLPPQIHRIYYDSWLLSGPVGDALCKFIPFMQDVSAAVSIYSMTVISLDRFYAIVVPMRVHIMTRRRCYASIALIWFVAVALHSPYFVTMRVAYFSPDVPTCILNWEPLDNARSIRIYFPLLFTLLYLVPLLVITVLYTAVIVELSRSQHLMDHEQRRIRSKENREVATMLITVVVCFAASWAPMNALAFLTFFTWNWQPPCYVFILNFWADYLIHSNCAQNAFIYFTFNKRYRRGLKQVVSSYCDPGGNLAYYDNQHTNGTSQGASKRTNVVVSNRSKKSTVVEMIKL